MGGAGTGVGLPLDPPVDPPDELEDEELDELELDDPPIPPVLEVLLDPLELNPPVDEEKPSPLKQVQRFLHAYPTIVPFVVLLFGVLLGASVNWTRFATGSNLSTILLQVTIIGILGIAQTLIILTAGIDLSVGIVMVLSSIVMGRLGVVMGWPVELAFAMGVLVGTACGGTYALSAMSTPPSLSATEGYGISKVRSNASAVARSSRRFTP